MILGNNAIRNETITGFTMKFRRLVLLFYILIIIKTEFDYCCNVWCNSHSKPEGADSYNS